MEPTECNKLDGFLRHFHLYSVKEKFVIECVTAI